MRAHTDALCLMSRWHFCSPSPPHRLSLTGNEWAERKSQRKERGKRGQMRVWEEIQHSACTSLKVTSPRQSQGSGFTGGPANQEVGKSERDQVSLPRSPPDGSVQTRGDSLDHLVLLSRFHSLPFCLFDTAVCLWTWFLLRHMTKTMHCNVKKQMCTGQSRGYLMVDSPSPWVNSFWIASLH